MQAFIVLAAVIAVANGYSLICRNYRSGAMVPNPENCAEFFMCRPGRAIKFSCPPYTLFNVTIQSCDSTFKVRCESGRLPEDPEYTPINAGPSTIEHSNPLCINKYIATLLGNAKDCSSFYQCSPTGVIAYKCPAGTLFDANRNYCERSDAVSCLQAPEIPVMPEIPIIPEAPTPAPHKPIVPPLPPLVTVSPPPATVEDRIKARCEGLRDGAKIRHPFNCRQYVLCSSMGRSQVFTCPAGTAFEEERSVCDWERNVPCKH